MSYYQVVEAPGFDPGTSRLDNFAWNKIEWLSEATPAHRVELQGSTE